MKHPRPSELLEKDTPCSSSTPTETKNDSEKEESRVEVSVLFLPKGKNV